MTEKFKIDFDTAKEEFNNFCDDWEIDNDIANMNDEDKTAFSGHEAKIINAIRRGRLKFDSEKSVMIYNIEGSEIVLSIPKGAAYMEMDKYKDREGVHKTYAVLGAMTGKNAAFFSNMDGRHLKTFMSVVALFLAS